MENVWLNLPVKDIDRTEKFYTGIGFSPNGENYKTDELVSFLAGTNKLIVHFFREDVLKTAINAELCDASSANEMMITIGSKSKEEIIETTGKIENLGGTVHKKLQSDGEYYGSTFADPDGHKWNFLLLEKGM